MLRVQQAADRAAQEAASRDRSMKMAGGDLLGPGEMPNSHLVRVENLMGSDNTGRFEYPTGHAAAGTFDGRAGPRACQFLMTSLEADMAADLQEKDVAVADDDHQLQVQAYAVPDVAAQVFERFSACTFNQLKTVLRRNAMGSATVDSLITELEGEVYEPSEDLGAWFNEPQRQYRQITGQMSVRDFKKTLAKLLPDASWHHPKVRKLEKRAVSLQECMEDITSEKMATIKSKIIEGKSKLATAAKKAQLRVQVWWVSAGEAAKAKKSSGDGVFLVGEECSGMAEDPVIVALTSKLDKLVDTVAAVAEALPGAAGQEKPKTRAQEMRAENEKLKQEKKDGAWERGYDRQEGGGSGGYRNKGGNRMGKNKGGKGKGVCFKCGDPGHYANECWDTRWNGGKGDGGVGSKGYSGGNQNWGGGSNQNWGGGGNQNWGCNGGGNHNWGGGGNTNYNGGYGGSKGGGGPKEKGGGQGGEGVNFVDEQGGSQKPACQPSHTMRCR